MSLDVLSLFFHLCENATTDTVLWTLIVGRAKHCLVWPINVCAMNVVLLHQKGRPCFHSCSSVKIEARAGNVFSIDWLLFSICSPLPPPLLRIGKPLTSETLVAEHLKILPI